MMRYTGKGPKKTEDCMVHLRGNFSKGCVEEMTELARNLNLPLSRAIAIAVDNELDTANPFNYPIPDISKIPYVEDEYFQEGGEIEKYILRNWVKGIGIDMLLLCRKDFNIPDKVVVMLALRELMKKERLSEIKIKNRWSGKEEKLLQVDPRIRNYVKAQRKPEPLEIVEPKMQTRSPLHDIDEEE